MRLPCLACLIAPLMLTACEGADEAPRPRAEPVAEAPVPAAPPVAAGATPDRTRADLLRALAAHPAGLASDSAEGRAVLAQVRPDACIAGDGTEVRPFDRICTWREEPRRAGTAPGVSLIIDGGLILGAVVPGLPQGVEGWDCQPAAAPPDHTICLATRVASAQAVAWTTYWNGAARR